jgi:uncharacterized membrane protein
MSSEQTLANQTLDRSIRAMLRHWVWILNGLLLVYAGLPWLSPLLRMLGFERLGQVIFGVYSLFCHQLPERSFWVARYQVCYCHRCTALYSSLLVMSLVYTAGRWRQSLSHRLMLLMAVPLAIDGTWHLLDDLLPMALRSADQSVGSLNFWLRITTSLLFSVGFIWWAYPRMERELMEIDSAA